MPVTRLFLEMRAMPPELAIPVEPHCCGDFGPCRARPVKKFAFVGMDVPLGLN